MAFSIVGDSGRRREAARHLLALARLAIGGLAEQRLAASGQINRN